MIDFIHIGMPKAASTWLQDVFFAEHPELCVIHNGSTMEPLTRDKLTSLVRKLAYGSDFSSDPKDIWCEIDKLVTDYSLSVDNFSNDKIKMGISHESLSGAWLSGRNARSIALAVHDRIPNAKVIILIREHRAIIESSYKQYIRFGGTASLTRFILDPYLSGDGYYDGDVRSSDLVNFLKYSSLIEIYQNLFGVDNVLVACMEEIRQDQQALADRCCDLLDVRRNEISKMIRANPSLSTKALSSLKAINRLFYTKHHRQHGPMLLARLSLLLGPKIFGQEIDKFEKNPLYLRELSSMKLHHYVVEHMLLKFDNKILKRLPGKSQKYSFSQLSPTLQDFLLQEFKMDNMKVSAMTGLDLVSLGYAT